MLATGIQGIDQGTHREAAGAVSVCLITEKPKCPVEVTPHLAAPLRARLQLSSIFDRGSAENEEIAAISVPECGQRTAKAAGLSQSGLCV
jgi:hypothetical protein